MCGQLLLRCIPLLSWLACHAPDPATSPNLQVPTEDNLGPVISLLHNPGAEDNEPLLLHALKALKILSRKFENR